MANKIKKPAGNEPAIESPAAAVADPPAAPTPPPEPPPAPTPEQIKQQEKDTARALNRFFHTDRVSTDKAEVEAEKVAAATPPPPATPEPAKPPEAPPVAPPAEKKPAAAAVPRQLPPDVAIEVETPPAAPTTTTATARVEAPALNLTDQDRELLLTYRKLESMKISSDYDGLEARMIKFFQDAAAKVEEISKANPEMASPETSDDYEEWASANQPEVDPIDYDRAREAILLERIESKQKREQRERDSQDELKNRVKEQLPEVQKAATEGLFDFIEAAHPDFKGIISTADGARTITTETETKMQEKDPLAKSIVQQEGEELSVILNALERRTRFPEAEFAQLNKPRKLVTSERIIVPDDQLDFAIHEIEQEMLRMPEAETKDEAGRQFVPLIWFAQQAEKISKSNATKDKKDKVLAELQNKYWTLDADSIRTGLIARYAQKARRKIEHFRQFSSPAAVPAAHPAAATPPKPATPAPAAAPPDGVRRPAPSISSASDVPVGQRPAGVNSDEDIKNATGVAFGRR